MDGDDRKGDITQELSPTQELVDESCPRNYQASDISCDVSNYVRLPSLATLPGKGKHHTQLGSKLSSALIETLLGFECLWENICYPLRFRL